MWQLDYKDSWVPNNWCFWTVVLEKTLESPFNCKEVQPVHPKGNQSWIFIGRTDAKAETPILWPPDVKNWLIWKEPDAGKDWRWEEKDWMASLTQWTWVWVSSGSWWCTGRPGVLQSMGSQRVRHDWATELNWAVISRETQLNNNPASPHECRVADVPLWAVLLSLCISTEDRFRHRPKMEEDHKFWYFLRGRHKIHSSHPDSSIQTGRRTSLSWIIESEASSKRWNSVLARLVQQYREDDKVQLEDGFYVKIPPLPG